MHWRDALRAAYPLPIVRRDAVDGHLWVCYLDGSVEVFNAVGVRVARYASWEQAGNRYMDWEVDA